MALTKSQKDFMAGLDSKYGFPNGTMGAIAKIESSGNSEAKSGAGATGYFQLMPSALKDAGSPVDDARKLSFEQQAEIAANHLNNGFKRFGDIGTALAGYNAGNGRMGRVIDGKSTLPSETADYVQKFMQEGIIGDDSPAVQYAQSAKNGALRAPDLSGTANISSGIGSGVDWDSLLSGKSNNGSSGVDWDSVLSNQPKDLEQSAQPFKAEIPSSSAPSIGDYAFDAAKGLASGALNIGKTANALGASEFLDPGLKIVQKGLINSATSATNPSTGLGEFTEALAPYLVPGAGPIGAAVSGTLTNSIGGNTDSNGNVDWEKAAKQGVIEGGLNALLLGGLPLVRALRGRAAAEPSITPSAMGNADDISRLARTSEGRDEISRQAATITSEVADAAKLTGVDVNALTPGMRSGSRGIAQAEGALASTPGDVQIAHQKAFDEIKNKLQKSMSEFGAESGSASEKSASIKGRIINNLDDMRDAERAAWNDVRSTMPDAFGRMSNARATIQSEIRAGGANVTSDMKKLLSIDSGRGVTFDGMKSWRGKFADIEQKANRNGEVNAARVAGQIRSAITEDMKSMAQKGGFLDEWTKANDLSKARLTAQKEAESIFGRDLASDALVTKASSSLQNSSKAGVGDFHKMISSLPASERVNAVASTLDDAITHGIRGGKSDAAGMKNIANLLTSQNISAIGKYSPELARMAKAFGDLAKAAAKPQAYVEYTGRTRNVLEQLEQGLPKTAQVVFNSIGNSTSGAIVGATGGGFIGGAIGAVTGSVAKGVIEKIATSRSGRYAIEKAIQQAEIAVKQGASPEAMRAAERRFLSNKIAVKAIKDAIGSEAFDRMSRSGIVATLSGMSDNS